MLGLIGCRFAPASTLTVTVGFCALAESGDMSAMSDETRAPATAPCASSRVQTSTALTLDHCLNVHSAGILYRASIMYPASFSVTALSLEKREFLTIGFKHARFMPPASEALTYIYSAQLQ